MIGTTLQDRYRLDDELGRGGMGVVYRGYDTLLERPVAVKVLSSSDIGPQGRARLLHEARAAAGLKHPNIISIYDAGETDGTAFIVMELLEGRSLFEQRPVELADILAVARQICAALAHAHAHGIVHRDLKLENVIVAPDGKATLTDFGLAAMATSRLTAEGDITGTVFYLSPEQILGGEIAGRADLYALGVMLYELTCGRLPFDGDDALTVISQHLYAPVAPPSALKPDIPPGLDALIVRLFSKQAADRPASAVEVAEGLDGLAAPEEETVSGTALDQLARGRLIGRSRELSEARAFWQRFSAGGADEHVLLISGEPGVGKTPLVYEIMALAQVAGATVLTAECYAEGSAPYAPLAQIVREALLLPGATETLPATALADLLSLAPDLRDRNPQAACNPVLDAQSEQRRLFESVTALCAALGRSPAGPQNAGSALVLVIEDIQWADAASLHLLRHLARRGRAARLRLLLLLTYREAETAAACCLDDVLLDLSRERLSTQIRLGAFTRVQTQELLASMFQQTPPPAFVDTLYRETEGNLFYIEEICKTLIEEGRLYRQADGWQWPDLHEIQLPATVRATIQARVAKLPERAQEVLRAAAIVGREFDFETLRRAAADGSGGGALDEDALVDALELAEGAQLIREARLRGPETFLFAHALIPAALREGLSSVRRRRLHRRVLAALEAVHPDDLGMLAYHAEQGGDLDRARGYYGRAAGRALAAFANEEAEKYLRSALAMAAGGVERGELLANLGEALYRRARYAEAMDAWHESIDLYRAAGDHDRVARLYAHVARSAGYELGAARGLELCQEGLAAVAAMLPPGTGEPETPGMAALWHETGRAYRFNNMGRAALPYCEQALALAQRLNLVEVQAETLATLGILPGRTPAASRQALTEAVAQAESAGLWLTAMRAHDNLGDFLREQGDLKGARAERGRGRDLGQRIGMPRWEYHQSLRLAEVLLVLAEFTAVEEVLAGLPTVENLPAGWLIWPRLVEAHLLRYRGRPAEAESLLRTSRRATSDAPVGAICADLNCTLAEVLIERGCHEEAAHLLAETIAGESPAPDLLQYRVWSRRLLSQTHLAKGRLDQAERLLDEATEQAAAGHNAEAEASLVLTEARLAVGGRRWRAADVAFADAAERFAMLGARWWQAMIMLERGQAMLSQAGAPADQAGAMLREAQSTFAGLGVTYYAAAAERAVEQAIS